MLRGQGEQGEQAGSKGRSKVMRGSKGGKRSGGVCYSMF